MGQDAIAGACSMRLYLFIISVCLISGCQGRPPDPGVQEQINKIQTQAQEELQKTKADNTDTTTPPAVNGETVVDNTEPHFDKVADDAGIDTTLVQLRNEQKCLKQIENVETPGIRIVSGTVDGECRYKLFLGDSAVWFSYEEFLEHFSTNEGA